jgi:hypothetical protein
VTITTRPTTTTPREIDPDDLIGAASVSTGTLRPDHLADALLGEIDRVGLSSEISPDLAHRAQHLACTATSPVAADLPDDAGEIVEELTDFLNDHAPSGWCLRPMEGDPADLGWQPTTLRAMLQAVGSQWVRTDWTSPRNEAIDDIIERYDDDPEALLDFMQSDWVNLAECYTHQLLKRWDRQEREIRALFDDLCSAIGATSTLECMEGQTIEDPDDFTAAYVNLAMTWGARGLAHEIEELIEG